MFSLRVKYTSRKERVERLKKIFDSQVISEPEANAPTQIALFLEDVVAALPVSANREHVLNMFECALNPYRQEKSDV